MLPLRGENHKYKNYRENLGREIVIVNCGLGFAGAVRSPKLYHAGLDLAHFYLK
ncbi:MAG: hypothetical protein U7126_31285 [Microcoleus sp.]